MKNSLAVLAVIFTFGLTGPVSAFAAGPAPVDLLSISTNNFVLLSETGITNTGSHTSLITGNIGSSPITAAAMDNVFCSEMMGTIYGVDAAYTGNGTITCFSGSAPSKTLVDNAVLDMGTAYTDAAGRTIPTATELGAGNIGGMTLAPGLYTWSTDVSIPTSVTLSGSSSDVWIFQIAGNLTIASGGSVPTGIKVILSGGALASNVFWQVGGGTGATLGTYSTFNGTILSAKQVIIETGAVLHGRALAQTQVTLDANPVGPGVIVSAPTVTTSPISSVSTSTAIWNGAITGTGGSDAIQSGFAYGTTSDLSFAIATSTLGAQVGTTSFTQNITGLSTSTTYYVRAYATNAAGTSFGSIQSATTTATYNLIYTAGANGSITGTSSQTVAAGASGTAVSAIPNSGYSFTNWSDLSTSSPRTDTSVSGNISVTANFTLIPIVTPTPAPVVVRHSGGGGSSSHRSSYSAPVSVPTPSLPNTGSPIIQKSFIRNLMQRASGADVQSLQAFLNSQGFVISNTGAGSPGSETMYFGPLTQAALARLQAHYGITPALGYFGPITRAKIQQMMATQ